MAKKEAVLKKIADLFDFPQDLVADLFRLTLVGAGQLFIENHRGIILYTPEQIRVGVRGGEIIVSGGALQVLAVFDLEILIQGQIDSLSLKQS